MGQRLAQTLSGYSSYRQRDGIFLFLLHRITGLGTLIFLTLHIVSTGFFTLKGLLVLALAWRLTRPPASS